MKKRAIAAALVAAFALVAAAQENKADRTLKVKLNYTGSVKVDDKHKIFLFVFDSPDFTQGAGMPIASDTAAAKDQTVTFSNLSASPVYVVAVLDPNGAYEGMSPPPSGSSMGMYSKEPGKPGPIAIEAGKTVSVDLAFDDSNKMP